MNNLEKMRLLSEMEKSTWFWKIVEEHQKIKDLWNSQYSSIDPDFVPISLITSLGVAIDRDNCELKKLVDFNNSIRD